MKESPEVAAKTDFAGAGLLSNGRYQVLITESGEGYSALDDVALTRWSVDQIAGPHGAFLYIQDLSTGALWSATHEPVRSSPDTYQTWLGAGGFHVRRSDDGIDLHSETCVAPDAEVELRRYVFSNASSRPRRLRLTSYAEVVLHDASTEAAHPAFYKLFVQTEHVPRAGALLARRRPRSPEDEFPLLLHMLITPDAGRVDVESDRLAFIGRGRSLADPLALASGDTLRGGTGSVLDPVLCLQTEIALAPGEEKEVILMAAAAHSREDVLALAERYRTSEARSEAFLQAALREQHERDRCKLGPRNADRYHRLAAGVLAGDRRLRAPAEVLGRDCGERDVVDSLGLDPARPLLLGRIADEGELPVARLLLKARDFWHAHGLRTQVILLNDRSGSYADDVQGLLREVIAQSAEGHDGVVLRHADMLSDDAQCTLQSRARLVVTGDRLDLLRVKPDVPVSDHNPDVIRPSRLNGPEGSRNGPEGSSDGAGQAQDGAGAAIGSDSTVTASRKNAAAKAAIDAQAARAPADRRAADHLMMNNGYGGFSEDGREYVIRLVPDADGRLRLPPMPWINVIANEKAGFIVSEVGAGSTWQGNSRENRLTPWSNDPVLDPFGEAVYLHDEESGITWSPTPGPAASGSAIEVHHGLGYSEFRQTSHELEQRVTMFVTVDAPLKIVRLDVTNVGASNRRLRGGAFARWVLGSSDEAERFVKTGIDEASGAITAVNPQNRTYPAAIAFAVLEGDGESESFTSSCEGFLGDGGLIDPSGMRADLDGVMGAGLKSCAAFNRFLSLEPGDAASLFFLLGQVDEPDSIAELVTRFATANGASAALDDVKSYWFDVTSRLQIATPSPEIDLLVNAWLPYQNLSCRIWGRSAFYQSGGAFGYRDQLQDASAFAATRPDLVRKQILLHAAHQFEDGDVMHWWHPPKSRGIRTRFSDDLLWLPYVILHYIESTGDRGVLDEDVPYLNASDVPLEEDEIFIEPSRSALEESLFKHCCRALDRSLTTGSHGLPLIGSGDWNDGMNRVGRDGRGESVWLGFFLFDILRRFVPICEARSEMERAEKYRTYLAELTAALEENGWDGEWYRRGFYDDGEVIGSIQSEECKIDALVQAWSVLSGAAPPDRAEKAVDAMEQRLVSENEGIIRLLSPPFDRTVKDPGYIKGYVPGVRENGGQYTHAALWAVRALAEMGRCERAAPLLAMLSPASHAKTREEAEVYKVEPYVIAADVYGAPPHVGRGGWTWYTGSAGWMHRVAVESILGFRVVDGAFIELDPCVPGHWDEYRLHYRHPFTDAEYDIEVTGSPATGVRRRVRGVRVNGMEIDPEDGKARVPIAGAERHYRVEITIGA